MRVKNLTLAELEERVITIGFVDENLYTQVRINCKELFDEHPDAIPSLAVQPPQGDAYPAVVTREGDIVVWNVAKSDVQYANLGRLQLTFVIGEIVAKSYVGKFVIDKSLMPDGEAPTPIENWITEANAILGEIPGTIAEAVDDALEEAKESGEFDGADGVSPVVNVTKTQSGHNIVITDAEGDHSFDVPDGTEGKDGVTPQFGIGTVSEGHTADVTMTGTKENPILNFVMPKVTTEDIVAVQDTQPTAEETAIWFPETPPTPVQVPTYAEHLELKEDVDSKVADVKYKGTSLVDQNGNANIPPAQTSTPGLAMVGAGYGLKAADPNGNSAGRLSTDAATSSHIRFFTDQYRPITPYYLPEAVFRGLAQVAGDDTQTDSQNPVGTYTDDAKAAIQEMLNVPDATENDAAHATLLTEIVNRSEVKDSTATEPDLDVSDEDGNVLLRLANGHIYTKNFDSSNVGSQDVEVKPTEETEPDIDVTDANGNAIARFVDGGFVVKQFDGRKYTTYSVIGSYKRQQLTLTINKPFKKGDRLVLRCDHLDVPCKPWNSGNPISYYEGEKEIASFPNGDCGYYRHNVTEDCDSISAVYSSTAFSRTLDVSFSVSVLGDVPITPTVITIKKDGSGDFDNLKDALDAIGTSANDVLNPYRIEIYPGTYDVFDDYTDEEISNIHDDEDPTSPSVQEGFVGPKLLDGMSLVGIGEPAHIILNGFLDTTKWAKKYRDEISTINMQGSSSLENLTIIATNLRYCVHDDFQCAGSVPPKRLVKHCVFRGYNVAYNPHTTYGAGCPVSGGFFEFIDCDFGENIGLHQSVLEIARPHCRCVNCKGVEFRIGDSSLSSIEEDSIYEFINCNFLVIFSSLADEVPHTQIRGIGGSPVMYDVPLSLLYNTQDVVCYPGSLTVGTLVEWYTDSTHGPLFRQAVSLENIRGVVVFNDGSNMFIQTGGYVRTDRLGLSSFSINDYVGFSNGSAVIVQNESDAFGKVAYITDAGDGFVKLNWR